MNMQLSPHERRVPVIVHSVDIHPGPVLGQQLLQDGRSLGRVADGKVVEHGGALLGHRARVRARAEQRRDERGVGERGGGVERRAPAPRGRAQLRVGPRRQQRGRAVVVPLDTTK